MARHARRQAKERQRVPVFASEDAERAFWAKRDLSDHFDWSKAIQASFPDLKPSTQTISIRLPASLLVELKVLANERDVPYQSLMKLFLADRVVAERKRRASAVTPRSEA